MIYNMFDFYFSVIFYGRTNDLFNQIENHIHSWHCEFIRIIQKKIPLLKVYNTFAFYLYFPLQLCIPNVLIGLRCEGKDIEKAIKCLQQKCFC